MQLTLVDLDCHRVIFSIQSWYWIILPEESNEKYQRLLRFRSKCDLVARRDVNGCYHVCC